MTSLLFLLLLTPQKVELIETRDLFTQIRDSEKANEQLLEITSGYTMDYAPVTYGYHAAAIMTKANHTFWPADKWSCFCEGRIKLEKVIAAYPNKLELRYIRYAVQKSSPSFLGYTKNMKEDKMMLQDKMDEQGWPDYFVWQVKSLLKE